MHRVEIELGKVGVFGVGHPRYWIQFPDLKRRLENYLKDFEEKVKEFNVEVVSAGLIDTPEKAHKAADLFSEQRVDLIFCNITTYARSHVLLPIAHKTKAHIVLVGLQPTSGMDYPKATTYELLANDVPTSLPEFSYALSRAHITFSVIFGMLYEDERAFREIKEWAQVATVLHTLVNAHVGFMGHAFEGMLDMYSDPTMFQVYFPGMEIEMVEISDLKIRIDNVTQEEIELKKKEIRDFFTFPPPGADPITGPVSEENLNWSARVAVGLDKLVKDYHLDGLAYYYRGKCRKIDVGTEYEKIVPGMIVGNSLLTGKGIPVAGEGDLKMCVAMLIMDRFGVGGSFSELHPADFRGNFVLIGHDGPAHIAISDEKPILRGLTKLHGKYGYGASVEFKVRTGPMTILALTQTYDGKFKFVAAEGESLPGPIPATGNTNTRGRFPPDLVTFIERWTKAGPTHHFTLSVNHNISKIRKLAKALGIDIDVVAEMKGRTL